MSNEFDYQKIRRRSFRDIVNEAKERMQRQIAADKIEIYNPTSKDIEITWSSLSFKLRAHKRKRYARHLAILFIKKIIKQDWKCRLPLIGSWFSKRLFDTMLQYKGAC